jgi:ubiquinone/menaquinone biosynthesis C-methylase UbiE
VLGKLTRFAKKPLPNQLAAIRATLTHRLPFPFAQIRNYREKQCKTRLFGTLSPLVPAVKDMFDGPADLQVFRDNGEEFLRIYKDICGLQPDEHMLDVGCGIGRKTVLLTQYLTKSAAYEGVDITKTGIEWCRKTITPRFPNFNFQQIDVYNKYYNPQGKYAPSVYKFPFADGNFDFAILGSVFTHMLPDDLSNYLLEVHRVLKMGGRCLITYFLLNEESLCLFGDGKSTLNFKHQSGKYRTISSEMPEIAIAFDESWITDLYRKVGLKIMRLDYGSWCGRQKYLSYQDMILGVKE